MRRTFYFKTTYMSFCAGLTALIGISRGLIYSNQYTALICIILALSCVFVGKAYKISFYDGLLVFLCIYLGINRYNGYYFSPVVFIIMASMCVIAYRDSEVIKIVLKVICAFSIVNLGVNLISIIMPKMHDLILKGLLNRFAYENAKREIMQNTLVGLSDHYSRNAFYCVAGGSVFFALAMAHSRKRAIYYILAFVEIGMIMIIGKRGHFLFIIASITIAYILTAESIKKSIYNSLKIFVIFLVILGFLIEFVPAASNVLTRNAYLATRDISNGRFRIWGIAINTFKDNPVFGIGFGFINSTVRTGISNQTWAGVHNDYLQWLCELGIVGFLINISIMLGIYVLSIKELKCIVKSKTENSYKELIIWSVIFQTFMILYSTTGLPHFDNEVNTVYCFSLVVPMTLIDVPECHSIRFMRLKLKW